jgi:orotidine-5'-phosphate decarboxylase
VERLARLSESSGADGVVCSANEVGMLSTIFGREFLKVTPGIRPGGVTNDDQKRIMSPSQAVRVGADYLVIGRPITQSEDPVRALEVILKEVQGEE